MQYEIPNVEELKEVQEDERQMEQEKEKEMEQEYISFLMQSRHEQKNINRKFLKISEHFNSSFFHKDLGFSFIKNDGKTKKGFYMPDECYPHEPCKREFCMRDFEDGYFIIYPETRMVAFFLTTTQNGIHYCGFCPCFEGKRSFYPSKFEGNFEIIKSWWRSLDNSIEIICKKLKLNNY
jgi:hypothetical protein